MDATHILITRNGQFEGNWSFAISANGEEDAKRKESELLKRGFDVIVAQITDRNEVDYDPR
ncbi:MAG TPA: hypothetical protein VEC17_02700 [Candidatus Binatia bacterium]|nr:hypothetical protein [Candidatus Binatia bacterium]